MRPEVEQELAHTLLVELLAYQFASPVRWIETQDVILCDERSRDMRLVEIGPDETLAAMARRTAQFILHESDAARGVRREILAYNKHAKEIYYDVDPVDDEPEPAAAAPSSPSPSPSSSSSPPVPPAAAPAPPPSAGPAPQVSDAPVTATDIVRAIIAQKLKKPLLEIPLSKAIKDLVGGKSTLQNEILGDLGKEFGSTPEKPEDTPLDELGASMQQTFNGELGKTSQSLIARVVSSKVPNSLGMSGVRKYLETRWGLPHGRQNGVLLLAITLEPAQRFKSENDAKAWLDDMANQYAAHAKIDLSSPVAGGDAGGAGAGMMMDPAAIDALTADQRMLFKKQLELLAGYLKMDLRAGDKAAQDVQQANATLQSQIDLWNAEHGDFYATGIEPQFTPLKARVYDSAWNWARQDALSMYYDIIFGRLKAVDREIVSRCIAIMNRANPTLLEFMQYHIDHCPAERGETYQLAKELGQVLIDNCREILDKGLPVYKEVSKPTAPHLEIDAKGNLNYSEIPRANIRKFEQYVTEMAEGGKLSEYNNRTKVQYDLQRIYKLIKGQQKLSKSSKMQVKNLYGSVLRALAMNEGQMLPNENGKPANGIAKKGRNGRVPASQKQGRVETVPFIHLKRKDDSGWDYSKKLTSVYLNTLEKAAHEGLSFQGKNALLTGAGAGSIGAEVLQGLISGGAKVVVTTSRYSPEVTAYYQSIYTRYGAKGSQLIVVPFNQGSKQDVQALVEYIYDTTNGLGWDLDMVIPFAAISENGREIDGLDSKSELAHRIMLTNLLRLLGAVKTQKQARGYETRPAQVILPLSPNHGTFGNDGMYAESKIALETLFTRWHSESWGNFLTICGAVIGWTRGTGLMAGNNIVAEGIEKYGVRTFSQAEMAFNLLGLMAPEIANLCQVEPVWADLNGGFQYIPNLKDLMTDLRKDYIETSEVRQAVLKENAIENKIVHGEASEALYRKVTVQPRANIKFDFPKLPDWETEVKPLNEDLKGMVDLEKVVVVTGFAEVGPWGNARTRWEMEAQGQFTLEGCVEMAWIMGLIKHFKGNLKTGQQYSGWVDAKTGEPVEDRDIKTKYEKHILEHSGIRLIEPELFNGYDPQKKELLQEIQIDDDLGPIEGSKEMAEDFKRKHGDLAEVFPLPDSDQYTIRLKKGAIIHVPKALRFDRLVAGQIPTGWDARKYGVPEDIISQVDPVTLFTLVCVSEALLTSGITDPYELYQYVHLSQVGNCIGSGIGGTTALRGMYKDRYLDKPLQKDILQESFINTMSAWVNMLLLSSTGPIKTPVGACATAVESVDIGYDTIVEGKARLCLVGGFDDFQEEGSYEFANMKATSNADDELARGRTPREMSRPTTTTRNGFMEAQGCGVQVLMDARLALDMGVPIYGIVALSGTATDKIGRSVPAPGKGVLTMARESPSAFPSSMLDIKHRRRLLERRLKAIKRDLESEISDLKDEIEAHRSRADPSEPFDESAYWEHRVAQIRQDAKSAEKEALGRYGNNFWKQDPTIAPIRGALATWNLTVDDLGVASFHGTSTVANDKNESDVINSQMAHLGRSKGNAVLGIFQKYLTGHPKGAAGAWMMNGCLQVLDSGLVPGNRNADNVDQVLEKFDYLLYPSRTIQTDGVKAFSVTSFGFGQKGAQVIGVHPKYLFATLDQTEYAAYKQKVEARQKKAYTYFHDGLVNNSLFRAKDTTPYADDEMEEVFLDPEARATLDPDTSQYTFNSTEPVKGLGKDTSEPEMERIVKALQASAGGQNFLVGYDEEKLSSLNIENETFLERNYTDAEIAYCQRAGSPLASFTGKWCAKEAVFKSLHVKGKGGGAAMKEIEILNDETGAPVVKLHGDAASAAKAAGVTRVDLTLSHGDDRAVAIAVAHRTS